MSSKFGDAIRAEASRQMKEELGSFELVLAFVFGQVSSTECESPPSCDM